jgi:hypothetical protein
MFSERTLTFFRQKEKKTMNQPIKTPIAYRSHFLQLNQLLIFFLALVFSILPLVLSLVFDKSSLALAIFLAWYALWPAVALFLLALWLYRKEPNWLQALGHIWMALSLWFLLQYIFVALMEVHLIFRLVSLPAVLAGSSYSFLIGGLVFLIGGIFLWWFGGRAPIPLPRTAASRIALGVLLLIALIGLPLFAILTARLGTGTAPGAPIPTEEQIFGYVSDVYNLGERRSGSLADHNAIAYIEAKFREFGYSDVRVEKSSFDYWEPVRWDLTVRAGDSGSWEAETFYVPYSGPTKADGITAEIVDLGDVSAPKWQNVTGKVVLIDIPAIDLSWDQMKLFTYMAFDPNNSTKGWHHPYPIGWADAFISFYDQVKSRHPAAIVGILRDYPVMGKFTYYCPYDGILRPIPGLYIQAKDGDRLKSAIAKGKMVVNIVLDAKVSRNGGESANVFAVLPGKSASTIIVHSHHDSPWRSGVEDSSGVGTVLGLAKYYAQVPLAQRERTMIFLLTGGHMVGEATNIDFVSKHKNDILARTRFDIAIEHIADDYNPPNAPTGLLEPRGIFMTENPVAVSQYASVIAQHDSSRSLIFPTGSPLGVPTDASEFSKAGVPVVSMLGGPTWLFDDDDTLDRVAKAELVPTAQKYVDFISRLNATPDWLLKLNLGWLTVGLLVFVFSPLAAATYAWRRKVTAG